jgi:hypothetical protein
MQPSPDPHYRDRFPAEILSHAVWLRVPVDPDPFDRDHPFRSILIMHSGAATKNRVTYTPSRRPKGTVKLSASGWAEPG